MDFIKNTRCYLVGSMDRTPSGLEWRLEAIKRFQAYGVECFNPYDKPISRGGEDIDDAKIREKYIEEENWDKVSELMKEVVAIDLRMVDVSDFILAYVDMEQKPFGTTWEICIANQQKKPIVVIVPGGKKNAPRWLFGIIPHKYIFANMDEAFNYLNEVNNGFHQDDRWKIFKYEIKK